jgi:hypothetical protein
LIGRIRRLERYSAPNPHFIFALEFTNVLFTRDARQIDARSTGKLANRPGEGNRTAVVRAFESYWVLQQPDYYVEGKELRVKSGFGMVWTTVSLTSK